MNIMLTVSYAIDIPRDAFFHADHGAVKEEIMERLEALFPREITLTENADAPGKYSFSGMYSHVLQEAHRSEFLFSIKG